MKGTLVNALIAINALLLGAFVLTVFNCARQGDASPREPEPGAPILSSVPAVHRAAAEGSPRPRDEMERASSLPFQQLYSADVRQFAANLRAAGCPEETVRDIVVAEVQALQERTQGFWEPADIAELDHLKAERSAFIDAVLDDRQWTEFKLHTEPAVAGFQKQLAMAEVNEDEMRALLLAARERGVSDLGAALSGGPESTEFLSAVLGGQRATELSRLQREPELRRFYGDLKAMGVEGEFIPPIYDLRQELQREIQVLAAAMDPQDPAQVERLHGEISRVQDQLREALGEEIWPQAQQEGWLSFPVRLQAVRP